MIDSVILVIKDGQFTFVKNKFFDAQSVKNINRAVEVTTLFSNAYKRIKKDGRYFPIISPKKTVIHKGGGTELSYNIEVQASLPKLLYGTNLYEITPADLDDIYNKLQEVLKKVGVDVTIENLKKTVLRRVDFSKSIRLNGMYGSANQAIKELSRIGYKQRTEMRLRDYLDYSKGCALKFQNNTQGYCIYDKFGEVVANGYTDIEKEWVEWMKENHQVRNLIRFEFSLQRKQSLDAFLKRRIVGKKKDFTLKDIMDVELSKRILLEIFDDTFDDGFACVVSLADMRENEIERILIEKNLSLDKHAKLSYLVNKAVKIGVQPTLQELKERYSDSTFLRYKKDILEIVDLLENIKGESPYLIQYLREKHEQFELLTPPRS